MKNEKNEPKKCITMQGHELCKEHNTYRYWVDGEIVKVSPEYLKTHHLPMTTTTNHVEGVSQQDILNAIQDDDHKKWVKKLYSQLKP